MNYLKIQNGMARFWVMSILVVQCLVAFAQQKKVYDVIVVGGGPSGIGAALAAAETGASTLLVERDFRIGGTTVQAKVTDMGLFHAWRQQVIAGPVWDLVTGAVAVAEGTLPDFSKQEHDKWMESCVKVNPDVYSRLAEEMLRKAGVELKLNEEITSIESTDMGWKVGSYCGRQVVDATGNATVAALAGAERVKSPDDVRQPGSYFFWLSSKGLEFDTDEVIRAYQIAIEKGELLPTDVHVGIAWFIRKGGGSGCYVPLADNSTPEARAETNRRGIEASERVLAFIRKQKGLEQVEIVERASEVGVRETYRVVGEKTITEKDYLAGYIHDDALAWSYWMVDQHNAGKGSARLVFHEKDRVGTVPLGAMLPKGVRNMLVAGRAVSSDHGANSALRVQASCMAMGQAAGVVAALAASRGCDPRDVPLELARQHLTSIGHIVPPAKGEKFLSVSSSDESIPLKEKESLSPVSFEKVTLEDSFWLPRLKTQKETLVPFSLEKTEPAVENLRRTGEYLKTGKGKLLSLPRYVASDLFKVMEGAAYLLTLEKDPELEKQMDNIIDIIAEAQCPDGYLYEIFTAPSEKKIGWGAGDKPYSFVIHSHELYNMGHMYEGAVAYYRATGKRKWLDVAEKNAHHINKVFFEGDSNYNNGVPVNQAPGHQEIELALVKLYQVTGNELYLDMAQKFIDIRGVTYRPDGTGVMAPWYAQQHLPVREQRTAEGHSVRAMYLYSGMADVVAARGDTTLVPALESIWHDIVDKKMHINGGLGAVPGIEGFGPAYELPNKDTYDETCAAVGNVLFNYRMFLATGDAKYVDVAEVALYNNVLAGVNLEGNRFFYVNVLEADGKKAFNHGRAGRSPWFSTACCPSNMARLIPQVPGMIYSHTDNDIFCGFYASSSTEVPLESGSVKLTQETDYPFDGVIHIEVTPEMADTEFTLWLRVPTWCNDRFVPGELYSYADRSSSKVVASVNGSKVNTRTTDGYLPIKRHWKAGDKVTLELPMPVRYSVAHELVKADSNRVCITRGPLVYCAEQPDNAYPASHYIVEQIGEQGKVESFGEGLLKGISSITLPAKACQVDSEVSATLKLIPYYAWNNRGDNVTMNVWFARDLGTAIESTVHTVGNVADVSATHTNGTDDVYAVADGKLPKSSSDMSIPRWTSWSQKGKEQQVTIKLKKAQEIESVSVYWYDDQGGVQLPVSWNMEYYAQGAWHPFKLYVTDVYGVQVNQFNMVHPAEPFTTDSIRLNITPREDATVGILEVQIE